MLWKAYPAQSTQSPEVTSKVAIVDEEANDSVKTLTEKLSAALLNISAKDDLVKQHAKVAEEAVSGILSSTVFIHEISLKQWWPKKDVELPLEIRLQYYFCYIK